jgi:hypothetical protein
MQEFVDFVSLNTLGSLHRLRWAVFVLCAFSESSFMREIDEVSVTEILGGI